MTNIKYRSDFYRTAYIVNIALLAMSLPLSRFTMSIFEITLVFLWIISGFSFRIMFRFSKIGNPVEAVKNTLYYMGKTIRYNFVEKFRLFFRNKPALILSSIYLLHIIGVLYSSNFVYVAKDLRIKIPILLFPIIFSSMPKLTGNELKKVFYAYIAAILSGVIIGFYLLIKGDFIDVRQLSPFISPVRFGLNIAFGFFILLSFIFFDKSYTIKIKIGFAIIAMFFLLFLTFMESITGLGVILFTSYVLLIILLFKTTRIYLRVALLIYIIVIPGIIFFYVYNIINKATNPPKVNVEQLDKTTSRGNKYNHDLNMGVEDGKYLGLYLCEKELRQEWNKRSKIKYDSSNIMHEAISKTLIRYLTSKNLRKDADGVDSLSDMDIHMIEQGIANINYIDNPGIHTRILKLLRGYEVFKKYGNPSGNSVMQRYAYTRGAVALIKKHFLFGVGTGDMEDMLYAQYKKMGAKLKDEFILHAHNEFLSITIAFGIFGLLLYIFALIYPPVKLHAFSDYYFLAFFIIIITSMIADDTIDTQSGATLFAFYYSLLLLGRKSKKNIVS